ncbi:hypothetical protein ES332_A10G203600v1 [Gossypium tomentosum]|uniref:Uncharacterized protein n=1 Tax=Gossypium tomentosum TaxID=34277 RepID=A0A5D2NSC3_GOSTO|nr:hypothetical protein ES332_A10G203600v1 [Gossypium tomentosum]TYI07098.1 hypothetical protein ES332_A10G203600v1 [Gossypium tomentosum]
MNFCRSFDFFSFLFFFLLSLLLLTFFLYIILQPIIDFFFYCIFFILFLYYYFRLGSNLFFIITIPISIFLCVDPCHNLILNNFDCVW